MINKLPKTKYFIAFFLVSLLTTFASCEIETFQNRGAYNFDTYPANIKTNYNGYFRISQTIYVEDIQGYNSRMDQLRRADVTFSSFGIGSNSFRNSDFVDIHLSTDIYGIAPQSISLQPISGYAQNTDYALRQFMQEVMDQVVARGYVILYIEGTVYDRFNNYVSGINVDINMENDLDLYIY